MTVEELLDRIGSKELTEWRAFERIDGPLGSWRDDHRAGVIAASFANRFLNEGDRPLTASEFIPKWEVAEDIEEDPRAKAEEQMSLMQRVREQVRGALRG